ncbi:MAG: tRNA 2-selenouridine(34) synthase MnmH, partial [Cyclobacteriaceae bacterium]|nr:tRNA 2-selenouridine(34) synthase MnmH [Cyclobacteriaceae bacterium]
LTKVPVDIESFLGFRHQLPVVDVRSEGEYASGHIPGTVNVPLLNNDERAKVGTIYKQKGQREAIHEGFRLVGPRLEQIIAQTEQIAAGRELLVHCWRGGMRSNNFCQFVGMARIKSTALTGGYKAYRQFASDYFKKPLRLILIGGCTGSGKSEVLRALATQGEQILDLETMANHKGSAFGALLMPPQPTSEQFHNDLFEALYKLDLTKPIWVEDESITIGKVFLPQEIWQQMRNSPLVQMMVPKEVRIQRLVNEYGPADASEFLQSMDKIVKRLGGQHHKLAREKYLMGDLTTTIDILLTYYDKYYLSSIENKKERVKWQLAWNGADASAYADELIKLI